MNLLLVKIVLFEKSHGSNAMAKSHSHVVFLKFSSPLNFQNTRFRLHNPVDVVFGYSKHILISHNTFLLSVACKCYLNSYTFSHLQYIDLFLLEVSLFVKCI